MRLKSATFHEKNISLSLEEVLTALSISAVTNPTAQAAVEKLPLLRGCQAHSTTILSRNDELF